MPPASRSAVMRQVAAVEVQGSTQGDQEGGWFSNFLARAEANPRLVDPRLSSDSEGSNSRQKARTGARTESDHLSDLESSIMAALDTQMSRGLMFFLKAIAQLEKELLDRMQAVEAMVGEGGGESGWCSFAREEEMPEATQTIQKLQHDVVHLEKALNTLSLQHDRAGGDLQKMDNALQELEKQTISMGYLALTSKDLPEVDRQQAIDAMAVHLTTYQSAVGASGGQRQAPASLAPAAPPRSDAAIQFLRDRLDNIDLERERSREEFAGLLEMIQNMQDEQQIQFISAGYLAIGAVDFSKADRQKSLEAMEVKRQEIKRKLSERRSGHTSRDEWLEQLAAFRGPQDSPRGPQGSSTSSRHAD